MSNETSIRTSAQRIEQRKAEHAEEVRTVSERAKAARSRMGRIEGFGKKLDARPLPGFHLCWVNDDGRVQAYLDRGYDFVENGEQGIQQDSTDTGKHVRRLVGKKESGDGLYAFLMKIPQEWFEEDQAAESARLDLIEQTVRRGGESRADTRAKQYVPTASAGRKETADAVTVTRSGSL